MELEQRVKALEYDMKILKNEIQRTLLDIQEQILIHYYPSLRTEETAPSEGIIQALESVRAKRRDLPQEASASPIKRVSLDEIGEEQGEDNPPLDEESVVVQPTTDPDKDIVMRLSGWVSSTARKIGGERTGKLIQAYTNRGIISSELESPLLRLVGLITDDEAPKKVAVNEVLKAVLHLNELLGRDNNAEEALSLIEEAELG
ncbi:MAG: hypothetical protein NUW24_07100 [Anaerolineae bacterium]|jgi:hypothetical protein|nr:hypothetical protein [Anaerolineae bacterium]MDH7474472.1 hypothetical protein [Anaerolineae bacterium]